MKIQIGKNSIKKICLLILSLITVSLAVIPLSAKTARAEISYDKSIATKSVYLTETGTGEVLFAKKEGLIMKNQKLQNHAFKPRF